MLICFLIRNRICASAGSANQINKLSLVGMQLPEKIYGELRRFERWPIVCSYWGVDGVGGGGVTVKLYELLY